MLRPNVKGGIEITLDESPYEHKLRPNRRIRPQTTFDQLEACKKWIEAGKRASRPGWRLLDWVFRFETPDLDVVARSTDEESLELDLRFEAFDLTEHQRLTLQKPEDRIKKIAYLGFVQKQAAKRRKHVRSSKWGNKFKKHFSDKTAASWRAKIAKHDEEHLKSSSAPKGDVIAKTIVFKAGKAQGQVNI